MQNFGVQLSAKHVGQSEDPSVDAKFHVYALAASYMAVTVLRHVHTQNRFVEMQRLVPPAEFACHDSSTRCNFGDAIATVRDTVALIEWIFVGASMHSRCYDEAAEYDQQYCFETGAVRNRKVQLKIKLTSAFLYVLCLPLLLNFSRRFSFFVEI